jgi:DcmR-like sensory protein
MASQIPQFNNLQDSSHLVQFYLTDAFLLDTVARFIGDSLSEGNPAIVVLTKDHREGLNQRLVLRGIDVATLLGRGLYTPLDAAETLSKVMVDGQPSEPRFNEVIGDLIRRASARGQQHPVRVFGEMVALLWKEGNAQGAVRLEELWNGLAKTLTFTLFCAYPLESISRETYGTKLLEVCAEHSEVITGEEETADLHKEIAAAVGSIKRSLTDIKTKLAVFNLQKAPQR